jgi:hypothetical protein
MTIEQRAIAPCWLGRARFVTHLYIYVTNNSNRNTEHFCLVLFGRNNRLHLWALSVRKHRRTSPFLFRPVSLIHPLFCVSIMHRLNSTVYYLRFRSPNRPLCTCTSSTDMFIPVSGSCANSPTTKSHHKHSLPFLLHCPQSNLLQSLSHEVDVSKRAHMCFWRSLDANIQSSISDDWSKEPFGLRSRKLRFPSLWTLLQPWKRPPLSFVNTVVCRVKEKSVTACISSATIWIINASSSNR